MDGKGPFCARRAPLLAEDTPYLLKRVQSCVKRAHFRSRRTPLLAEGAQYHLGGVVIGEKAPFRVRKHEKAPPASTGGRGAISP